MTKKHEQNTNARSVKPQRKVAVVYQLLAHYRQPIITELIKSPNYYYEFLADNHDFGAGIKLATEFDGNRYIRTRCFKRGRLFLQFKPIMCALGNRYHTLILLGNPYWPTTWIAALLARLRGKRVLFWSHGWIRKDTGFKRILRNTFFKLAHATLLYGHRAKVIAISEGFSPDKLHVIYNSLDCKAQDEVRKQLGQDDRNQTRERLFPGRSEHPILINITRLNPFKKLDMLIRSAKQLEDRGQPVNVLIVGDGEHKQALEELADELGVHAVFTGALYEEHELGQMLNAADCAVMPGPIGLLVMHALAYGVPLISNDNFDRQMPEIEAILPGSTGELFEDGNQDSLTDSIQRMIDQPLSYEQRYAKAREIIERFYNPFNQRKIIDRAVDGLPADDRFNAWLPPYTEEPTC